MNFLNNLSDIPIEEILSSKGRTKIIKILALDGETNITNIVEKTKLNHTSVISHLDILVDLGLVQEKKYGRIRIFRYKSEFLRANALKKFIEFWENPNLE